MTNSLGKFTAYVPRQNSRFYVRAWFAGDPDTFMRVSSQRTVMPKVYLSRPSGKSTVSRNKYYTYYGYLKPKHTAGSQRVWIKCYRYSSGKYRLRKTYTTTLSDYSSYTKYLKKVKLYPAGKWRIRAYYKSTFNNADQLLELQVRQVQVATLHRNRDPEGAPRPGAPSSCPKHAFRRRAIRAPRRRHIH